MVPADTVSVFPFVAARRPLTAMYLYIGARHPHMIDELADAAADLAAASGACESEDAGERLEGLEAQLSGLAESERGADHGRLARIQRALDELEAELEGEALEAIRAADERIDDYRETVDGV